MKILLVEDNDNVRNAMKMVLDDAGYNVTTAVNGDVAVQRLGSSDNYDLVISDIIMPEKDGFEVLDYIKAMAAKPKVIVISGGGNKVPTDMIVPIANEVADRVLLKPFSNDSLLEAVNAVA